LTTAGGALKLVQIQTVKCVPLPGIGTFGYTAARLQMFITDKTKLSHANPTDDRTPARVVAILRERTPEAPLFKFLWRPCAKEFCPRSEFDERAEL